MWVFCVCASECVFPVCGFSAYVSVYVDFSVCASVYVFPVCSFSLCVSVYMFFSVCTCLCVFLCEVFLYVFFSV